MEHINVTNDDIKHIHKLVYDELKTRYKINKFVKECKKLNECITFGDLNQKIIIHIKWKRFIFIFTFHDVI